MVSTKKRGAICKICRSRYALMLRDIGNYADGTIKYNWTILDRDEGRFVDGFTCGPIEARKALRNYRRYHG